MGRSRAVNHSADDDSSQSRSKRKRTASSADNMDSTATIGQVMSDGKKALYHCNYCNKDISGKIRIKFGQVMSDGKKALYHCNYCNKDISGKIRIKCVMCPDFDLCVECFSVGAEIKPHKSNHPYRVMDNLSFPLFCPDWNADEEMLLLEGIEMYGLGNWAEVAEHVGTKSKASCIDHYNAIYMNSPCFPLPDMSHVVGKNREELLAMAKEQGDLKKAGEGMPKEDPALPAKVKVEELRKDVPIGRSSEAGLGAGSMATEPKASNAADVKDDGDGCKVEDRSIGEKKPRISGTDGPSLVELSGYNPKRQEFETEYDNDAEQLLADMEFKETDTEAERELKLRVLRIYWRRLEERKRRKDFILERNLLYPDPFEKGLSPEEKELCQRYRVFMRFHSKEEHEELLRTVVEEHRILKRIQDLKDARAAGCRTSAEAEQYISLKRKREAEEYARRAKESTEAGSGGKALPSPHGVRGSGSFLESGGKDSSSTTTSHALPNPLDEWDITGFPGADLLSENEKRLCKEMRILPSHYLNMLQVLSVEVMKGNVTKKSDAYPLFKVDPAKLDRVYDMLVKKGIAPP